MKQRNKLYSFRLDEFFLTMVQMPSTTMPEKGSVVEVILMQLLEFLGMVYNDCIYIFCPKGKIVRMRVLCKTKWKSTKCKIVNNFFHSSVVC